MNVITKSQKTRIESNYDKMRSDPNHAWSTNDHLLELFIDKEGKLRVGIVKVKDRRVRIDLDLIQEHLSEKLKRKVTRPEAQILINDFKYMWQRKTGIAFGAIKNVKELTNYGFCSDEEELTRVQAKCQKETGEKLVCTLRTARDSEKKSAVYKIGDNCKKVMFNEYARKELSGKKIRYTKDGKPAAQREATKVKPR